VRKEQVLEMREQLRDHPELPLRSKHCGRTRYQKTVQLMTAGGAAWWHGVVCCRARVCPSCHVARRFKLAGEVNHVVNEREGETSAQSYLATFTVRHHTADPVTITRQVRHAWRAVLQSRGWQTFRKRHGTEWIAAEEITFGDNGYHPHIHALLMPRQPLAVLDETWQVDGGGRLEVEGLLCDLWSRAVERKLGAEHAPDARYAVDVRECDASQYLTKIGLEMTDPTQVKGCNALELLASGQVDRYMELQASRTRARDITFSRGLRDIREAMPAHGEMAELAEVSGSDWGLMYHRMGWRGPLAVAMAARDPETAQRAIADVLHGKMPSKAQRDDSPT
jgi:hypothetical protein